MKIKLILVIENISVDASYIHVIGDLIQSVGVIIASVIIYFYPNMKMIDPLCTFIFSLIVLYTTVGILKDCIRILMETAPDDIDIDQIKKEIRHLPHVHSLEDIHIWSLSVDKRIFTCQVTSSNPTQALKRIKKLLNIKYRIFHVTIQVEPILGENQVMINWDNDVHE